jgi:hypothetical protein
MSILTGPDFLATISQHISNKGADHTKVILPSITLG